MVFRDRLEEQLVSAAKAQNRIRLSSLRLIKNALHNREIDLRRELSEAEFLQVLAGMVKQRKDSIDQFEKGGRLDLVEREKAELKVIEEFMPALLDEAEIDREIAAAIGEVGAAGIRDMGKVMKVLMPKLTGRADGKLVGEKVKARLSG
jgi:hypothetical protein